MEADANQQGKQRAKHLVNPYEHNHTTQQSGLPKRAAPRYDTVKGTEPTFGGDRAKLHTDGGRAGGSLVTRQNKGTRSGLTCQPACSTSASEKGSNTGQHEGART